MTFLSRLESRFRRYALPNVTVILIAGQVLMYVAAQLQPARPGDIPLEGLLLFPDKVWSGEVWRLITFLFYPPLGTNINAFTIVFSYFFWYLFYLMGTTLEINWGAFRYNVFLGIGYLATVAAAIVGHLVWGFGAATNGFLEASVFLAFARMYPDFTIQLFFLIPVKIKWLARIQWFFYGLTMIFGDWVTRILVMASVVNFFVFFGREVWRDMKQSHRRMRYQSKSLQAAQRFVHKCHVCGATSDENPRMQFRYCSKCVGQHAYCPEHLHNHEHVVEEEPAAAR